MPPEVSSKASPLACTGGTHRLKEKNKRRSPGDPLMRSLSLLRTFAALAASAGVWLAPQPAAAQEITIGFSMAMTGGLGPNGKSALLAQKIWEEDINKKGGLLGRPVKLVYYDDQTNPAA